VFGRRLVAIAAIAVAALSTLWVVELNVAKGLSWSVSFCTVGALVVAVLVAAVVPVRKLLGWARIVDTPLPLGDTTPIRAREDLARALASIWTEEERLRRINDPWPLPVRWSGSDTGQFDQIAEFFTRLPHRRLVILGPAGAGKTALVVKLVRELLEARRPGDAVPVLLSAATWTDSCTMTEWVAGQLTLDHPGLAVKVRSETGDTIPLARSLAASEVLPIIDGLDELPEERRAQVIAEVNAYGSDSPVVLTCRPEEYEAATTTRPVTLASIINLVPLALVDVQAYLTEATEAPPDRWRSVFDKFDTDPGGPLAEALTNPLMLWLARTVYERGTTAPGELVDCSRFANRDAIEGHLLAGFVPAAYAPRAQKRGFRCSPAQAQRWLSFLAAWQSRFDSQDIAWWRLCWAEAGWSALIFAIRTVLYTCVIWGAITWALIQRRYWRDGSYTLHDGFRDLLLSGPLGREVRPLTGPFVKGFLGPGFDSNIESILQPVVNFGLARAAVVAAIGGLILGVLNAGRAVHPQTPRMTFAKFRSVVLWRWLLIVILAWLVWASRIHREPIAVIASLWRTQLMLIWLGVLTAGWVLTALAVPVDVSSSTGPVALLRSARWVYILRSAAALATVATFWLWAGTAIAAAYACVIVAGFVIAAVLGSTAGGAWPRYLEAKLRLSVRRRLPWRTMSFLSDAHRRGVLRQVGAAYQFRHILLQEQLAAGYSSWPPSLAPMIGYARSALSMTWTFARGRFAHWLADSQTVTVEAETVSGVIAVRSPGDSVRQQIASHPYLLSIMIATVLFAGLFGWYYFCAGLFLIGLALVMSYLGGLRRQKAGRGVVPRTWSLRATSERIFVSQDGVTVSIKMSDVERFAAKRVRNSAGSSTEWTALCARMRRGHGVKIPMYERWLPLVWLTTKGATKGYLSLPQVRVAIQWFPDALLDNSMIGVKRVMATEYSASGQLAEPSIPWINSILPSLAVSVALYIFGQSGLGFVCLLCCTVMLGICLYRSNKRAAIRALLKGRWSLHITQNEIDVDVNGVTAHLTPEQIEEVDLQTLHTKRGMKTLFSAVQLRLRPGVHVPYTTQDGWFPIYLKPVSDITAIPTELIAALRQFAGHRIGSRLSSLAITRGIELN